MLIVEFSTFMLKTLSKVFKLKGHSLNFGYEELKHTYAFIFDNVLCQSKEIKVMLIVKLNC